MRVQREAYRIFVPGVLVQLAIFGTFFVGFALISELRAGVIERTRVTPVSRLAMLLGRSLRDVVTLLFQCLLITVLSIPFGLTAELGNILLAFVLLGADRADAVRGVLRHRAEAAQRGRAGPTAQHGRHPGAAAVRHPAADRRMPRAGCATSPSGTRSPGRSTGARSLFAGNPGDPNVWKALVVLSALTVLRCIWAARSFAKSVR